MPAGDPTAYLSPRRPACSNPRRRLLKRSRENTPTHTTCVSEHLALAGVGRGGLNLHADTPHFQVMVAGVCASDVRGECPPPRLED